MKLTVGILFGGRSVEHDISIITGEQLISKINEVLNDHTLYEKMKKNLKSMRNLEA